MVEMAKGQPGGNCPVVVYTGGGSKSPCGKTVGDDGRCPDTHPDGRHYQGSHEHRNN